MPENVTQNSKIDEIFRFSHRNKYMEEKFHREKKTIELIETLVECIEN
jgi:hypothetical protein